MSIMTLLLAVFATFLYFSTNVKCSSQMRKIVKGRNVRLGELPFQVLLEYKPVHPYTCGGVIIDKYHIMTTASCVKHVARNSTYATAGIVNVNDRSGRRVSTRIGKWYKHKNYSFDHEIDKSFIDIHNDIAIGRVDEPFKFNEFVKAGQLLNAPIEEDMKCEVSGWSKNTGSKEQNDILQVTNIPIVNTSYCQEKWSKWIALNPGMQCAGSMEGEGILPAVCLGDEGGLVMCEDELVGIISHGSWNCGYARYIGLFTDLYHYADWIKSTLEESHRELAE